jgi:uncharacterized protein YbjT (DUF2867 family)
MKIVLTGSLGHISKPLAKALIQKKHTVTVISSDPGKQKAIEALGAHAAIGSLKDVDFITATFAGADAVYCMVPPEGYFNPKLDLMVYVQGIADNFKQALEQTGVKRVVHLSSIGAHTDKGNGMLAFHYRVEQTLRQLPPDVAIKHLRPLAFYYNLNAFIPVIKAQGVIATNYGADDRVPQVSPIDIAAAAVEAFETPFEGRTFRYIASDEPTCHEIATTLGEAIGKPDLKWIVIPDEELLQRLIAAGMNATTAQGYVNMNASMHSGLLFEDYYRNRPVLSSIKIGDFAKEFAAKYNQD